MALLRPAPWLAAVSAVLAAGYAFASGHYVVDDADLIDARSCEAEIWHTDVYGGGHGSFLSPTCRLDGNWQVTATAGFLREAGENAEVYGLEAKILFLDLTWTRELGGDREEAWTVGVNFVALNF
ncbi:hypothetical protein Tgr7_0450 [Thioalkalivibrio sulfidiphilus HL-EbGr7]|uniref:Uncharacterized protein n=1 Tax=Thioalkalivibrio sulfidiphilus (strain HL-EbGR7) TaxID=396588 RepID=B8GL30_THISH|nr:hypothetical protein [Thioalkalivibrio sulfidiphilus]ACL71548.1 hypothetical protein Tgr7_0450 [Thioalkalivibrio sulfidiphilus HL-EbGr7]